MTKLLYQILFILNNNCMKNIKIKYCDGSDMKYPYQKTHTEVLGLHGTTVLGGRAKPEVVQQGSLFEGCIMA